MIANSVKFLIPYTLNDYLYSGIISCSDCNQDLSQRTTLVQHVRIYTQPVERLCSLLLGQEF